ncbi:EcsC family protein [Paenibacillus whitsoniae]|uniref:EcsC family protein n=1 Tax=Paenibacillus whitsoniae TaxID=2496558 RepID=A0A3S0CQ49_9BACL|nr:EcsC family protein [Paenibacillus whitsoniae]RTE02764.1 EcsC family protein [Paenibacillus whitsoniae]
MGVTQQSISKALDWGYEKALTGGIPGTNTAYELAEEYLQYKGELRDRVNLLIRWQNARSATSGFVTGLGGAVTLPIAIPANIASVLYIQLRMVAAIAIMGGHDVKDDKVRTVAYACLCGNTVAELLKDVGIQLGKKFSEQALKKLSAESIRKINEAVGFRLFTKYGKTGVINLHRVIPFVGGVTGAVFDGVSTNVTGKIARKIFIE